MIYFEAVQKPYTKRLSTLLFLLTWLGIFSVVYINQQHIIDWWKLRNYTPSAEISALASSNTMTSYARHLLYVNKPVITTGANFAKICPQGAEKTVVLGCYKGVDKGIWLYKVTDSRLAGVVEVTAAHEMLHAAYDRLPTKERQRIDSLLEAYYQTSLTDQRIKDTIEAYKKSEPTELSNEMHSIFATEVSELPSALETYYLQYFTNRSKVVAFTERYQSEFTNRQNRVAAYDAQLVELKKTIETGQASLEAQRQTLDTQQEQMESLKSQGDIPAYNSRVTSYNRAVASYNALREQVREQINTYNDTVEKRNAIALEERELTKALSASGLPAEQ